MRWDVFLLVLFAAWNVPAIACADGGRVRFSGRRDNLRITVFTAPSELRAGLADISVFVQHSDTGQPLLSVPILVSAYPVHEPWRRVSAPATPEGATNKLFRAAQVTFSEPGEWHVEVVVHGSGQEQVIRFDLEVAAGPPPWLDLSLWIGWPLLAIAAFAVHQWLVHRSRPFPGQGAKKCGCQSE